MTSRRSGHDPRDVALTDDPAVPEAELPGQTSIFDCLGDRAIRELGQHLRARRAGRLAMGEERP
ncbi:hypothetical protein SPF06_18645 [Sinomonas sp. JGH33]|uniref:Uncharacterized protein n=1 Tax=Sinomonas terricola TaxID=3110330 RepID=A0ABU5TB44_9MICC|nr:hypothetical protein [Sinomonas sp. JGH33]MEA5456747.1 hypothetical protein [Sinomonas sp. JGH33]